MSGFWSFREAGLAAHLRRDSQTARQPTYAVTRVLPVGVEFTRALGAGDGTRTETPVAATPTSAARDVEHQRPHHTTDTDEDSCLSDNTDAGSSPAKLLSLSSLRTTTASISTPAAETADLVGRDEAITCVQKEWWRRLDVDVRPCVALPSAELLDAPQASCAGPTPSDAESARTAQLLLARLSSPVADGGGVVSAGGSGHGAVVAAAAAASSRGASAAPAALLQSSAPAPPRQGVRRWGHRDTKQLKPSVGSESRRRAARFGVAPAAGATLVTDEEGSQRAAETSSAPGLRRPSSSPALSSDCATVVADVRLDATEIAYTCLEPPTACVATPIPSLVTISDPLTSALRSTSRGGASLTEARERDAQEQQRLRLANDARVLLRHFYFVWAAAAENRRIERCAASYHERLLQCIRETLQENEGNAAECW